MSTDSSVDRRRRHPRAPCAWVGRLTTLNQHQFDIKVKNISIGGAALQAPCLLKVQDRVLLEFNAHYNGNSLLVRVISSVAFIVLQGTAYDIGVQFISNTDAFRDFIKNYVNHRIML